MSWQGEEIYAKALGIRGIKCLVLLMMQEINVLRAEQGMSEYDEATFLNHFGTLMTQYESDDEGPEIP